MNDIKDSAGPAIAITGLACRFPGEGNNLKNFWDSICNGKSAWSEIPQSRFNRHAFGSQLASGVPSGGHFLTGDISVFDAPFFSITAEEASAMDPQQRLMIEVVYEAFETAGYADIKGTSTGVFMGQLTGDYHEIVSRDIDTALPFSINGLMRTSLANRISWLFDLKGPSFTLDTACSSSMTAFHQACQSLKNGECDLAVVGGCNIMIDPSMFVYLAGQGFLSPDGKCKSFDISANGYGRGEGISAMILRRVDDAISHADPIRAIVRGTGINQDGHTKGFTLPSAEAQASLIREVYHRAGLDFSQTGYVEAHGTGTQAGDLEETTALANTISAGLSAGKLFVGSVKSNAVMMLENQKIPPNLYFHNPNPAIKFDEWNLEVPTKMMNWPPGPRRISVNSFGYGGSNAHVILDDAESFLNQRGLSGSRAENSNDSDKWHGVTSRLFAISAQDKHGIGRVKRNLLSFLKDKSKAAELDDDYLADLAYTLNERRSHLQWKTYSIASSLDELLETLDSPESIMYMSSRAPQLGFVFTGQGAQWANMGMELFEYATFRDSIEAADAYLKQNLSSGWSVIEELSRGKSASKMGLAVYSQALCTVLQVALVDLLLHWNIMPVAVVGHSSGEIAAAYCMGVLSREDAWKVAYFRGLLSSKLRETGIHGAMMAVGASAQEAEDMISKLQPSDLYLACINSEQSVTISGDVDAIDKFHEVLQSKGIFARKLQVDIAYHSPHMEGMAPEYFEAIADISTNVPKGNCEMHSSVTGSIVDPSELGASYWIRNAMMPVQFASAVQNLIRNEGSAVDVLVEIGPHSALMGPSLQSLKSIGLTNVPYYSALTRNQNAIDTVLNLAGTLFARGYPVNFSQINAQYTPKQPLVDLPAYPWNHSQSLWAESRVAREYRLREEPRSFLSLLGAPFPSVVAGEYLWRGHVRLSDPAWAWLADHKISGSIVCPGAGFIAMVIEAALFIAEPARKFSKIRLKDINLTAAMVVAQGSEVEYTVSLRPRLSTTRENSSIWKEFTVTSCVDKKVLTRNCLGLVMVEYEASNSDEVVLGDEVLLIRHQEAKKLCGTSIKSSAFYQDLASIGLQLGESFQNVAGLKIGPGKSCCTINIPDIGLKPGKPSMVIQPVVLDAIFQMCFAALRMNSDNNNVSQAMVPKSIHELVVSADIPNEAGMRLQGFSDAKRYGFKEMVANIVMTNGDEKQRPVVQVSGLYCSEVAGSGGDDNTKAPRSLCSKLVWRPAINLLKPEEQKDVIIQASRKQTQPPNSKLSIALLLFELIRLVHHRKPELAISEFVASTANSKPFLADSGLVDVFKTAACSIWCNEESTKEVTEKAFAEVSEDVNVELRDLSDELPKQEEPLHLRDLIIVSSILLSTNELEQVIRNARQLLATSGRLCVILPTAGQKLIENLGREVGLLDWIKLDDFEDTASQQLSLLIGSQSAQINGTYEKLDEGEIVILQPETPSSAGTHLAEQLEHLLLSIGRPASVVSWSDKDAMLASTSQTCISLLELEHSILKDLTNEQEFGRIKALILESKKLLWVSGISDKDASSAMVTGLARVVRNEEPGLGFHTLHINKRSSVTPKSLAEIILRLLSHSAGGSDNEFMVENGVLCVSRISEDDVLNEELYHMNPQHTKFVSKITLDEAAGPVKLSVENAGLLDSLCFELDPIVDEDLEADEIEITVKASSLNFRDVMIVMGNLPGTKIGFEAAGVVRRIGSGVNEFKIGDRVAMISPGGHRAVHKAKVEYCQVIPDGLTFEEAATIPIVHGTAWYSLIKLAKAQEGQSVLIHAASGGVGQAAIQIAQHLGMKIFATVSDGKRTFLRDSFNISEDHIFSSRNLDFVAGIKRMTAGRGVDVVINSLSGEALQQSWSCIAPSGVFVEIGMKDILDNARLDMRPFLRSATFTFFDITTLRRDVMKEVMNGIFKMLCQGIIRPPTPITTYEISEVESAFRLMQTGRHVGKIVLTWESSQPLNFLHRRVQSLDLDHDAAYLLVGGLGGLGRSLSRMLVDNGARKLCFLARSGAKSVEAQNLVQELKDRGIQVLVLQCDVADGHAVRNATRLCLEKLGQIRGVLQCAMVLRDVLFRNMTHQDWVESTRCKVQGTWNLHQALQQVDFFIVLSSFAAIFGNRGQSNYAAASAYQDAIAHLRRARGLHAVTVDVGLMRDVGVLAEQGITAALQDWEIPYGIRENELANIIKLAITGDMNFSVPPQIITGLATGGSATAAGIPRPWYLDDPKFAILAKTGVRDAKSREGVSSEGSMQARLSGAKSQGEGAEIILDALASRVAKMLQTTVAEIDTERFLHSYGIDSLAAIELVNWALKECKSAITVFDIMAAVKMTVMAKKIAGNSKLLSKV